MINLKPYQNPQMELAVRALTTNRFFIDTSTTGAGKTYIALKAAERLSLPILVITPKSAHTQWARVAAEASTQVLGITNPESLIRSPKNPFYDSKNRLWRLPSAPLLVIFDEIHRGASGIESLTTEAVGRLKAYPNVKLMCMSATLAETPLKMRATGYWLDQHKFNIPSFYNFCLRHNCTWEMVPNMENKLLAAQGNRTEKRLVFTQDKEKAREAMTHIRQQAGDRMAGLSIGDIPDFPEQMLEIVLIDLDTKDRKEIEKAYNEMSERLLSNAKSALAQTTRERERIEFIKSIYMAAEADKLREDGFAVPIFMNFTSSRLRLMEHLKPPAPPQVYGSQVDDRQAGIDAFQANLINCIVIMSQAGGLSINLHDVHHAVPRCSILSPSFSASEFLQCLGRTRRIGGTKALYRVILVANTKEERIAKKLENKIANLNALNDEDFNPFHSS